MVMERSWNNGEIWKKSWHFVISQGLLPILPLNFTQFFLFYLVTGKKLSSNLESLHFLTFSSKCRECIIGKRDGQEKICCQVCGNLLTDKYVGTCSQIGKFLTNVHLTTQYHGPCMDPSQ